jgi:hemoglobin-like flavoprotein
MATREQFSADRATSEQNAAALTAEQRWLVQASWEKVVPMAPYVAELFYDRLFELDPLLEDLFPASLSEHGKLGEHGKLWMTALGLAVAQLEEPCSIAPCFEELSRCHVQYGVRPANYVTMGDALLWTLEQSLAEDFTPRVKEAWGAVYELLSVLLIESDAAAAMGREPGSARRAIGQVGLGAHQRVG